MKSNNSGLPTSAVESNTNIGGRTGLGSEEAPRRLLITVPPYPLESLESYLARLGHANYYEQENWYVSLMKEKYKPTINGLLSPEHYHILSELTGLSIGDIYNLTIHCLLRRFYSAHNTRSMPALNGDKNMPLWNLMSAGQYVVGAQKASTRICPLCWRERAAAMLPWSLRHITVCFRHQVLLVDSCEHCGRRLQSDFMHGQCIHCKTPFMDIPTTSVAADPHSRALSNAMWSALGLLNSNLSITDPNTDKANSNLPATDTYSSTHLLSGVSPDLLVDVLPRLGRLIAKRDPENPLLIPDWAGDRADIIQRELERVMNIHSQEG